MTAFGVVALWAAGCKNGNVVEVLTTGAEYIVARHRDGTLSAWIDKHNDDDAPCPVDAFSQCSAERADSRAHYRALRPVQGAVSAFGVGPHANCAVVVNSQAKCWGEYAEYVEVGGMAGFTGVQCSGAQCCFWNLDDTLTCDGLDGTYAGYRVHFESIEPVSSIAFKGDSVVTLRSDGVLDCNGEDLRPVPCDTSGWDGVAYDKIDHGAYFLALLSDGSAVFWTDQYDDPHVFPGPYSDIAGGSKHFCGLFADQHVECESLDEQSDLTPPEDLRFLQISAGGHTACGTTTDHRPVCWGEGVPEELLE